MLVSVGLFARLPESGHTSPPTHAAPTELAISFRIRTKL